MTYGEILTHLNISGSEESGDDFETMAKVVVNFIYNELLAESNRLIEQREGSLTFTEEKEVPGEDTTYHDTYGMPIYFKEITAFLDETNDMVIDIIPKEEFDRRYVGIDQAGISHSAYPLGHYGVQKFPDTAGILSIISSDASDTGSDYQVVISGMSDSTPIRETVDMTGTTAVTTANSYDASNMGVQRIVLTTSNNAEFTGNVTIKDVDGNTLAVIPPFYEKSPTFAWYGFYPEPDSASTVKIRGLARKQPLTNSTDWPEIDSDYHDLLIYGAEEILLPHAGKMKMGMISGKKYQERKKAFLGRSENTAGKERTFSNITNRFGASQRANYYRRLTIEST